MKRRRRTYVQWWPMRDQVSFVLALTVMAVSIAAAVLLGASI